MTAITEGGKQQQLKQRRQMGINNILVKALDLAGARLARARRANARGLTTDDLEAIRKYAPGVEASTAWKSIRAEIRHGERAVEDTPALGVTGDFQSVVNFHVAAGRFIDARDEAARSRVCVLGAGVADGLGLASAEGDAGGACGTTIIVGDEPFTVVGVMARKKFSESGVADVSVSDRNREVYVPYATLRAYYRHEERESELDAISLRMASDERLLERSQAIRRIVAALHEDADDSAVAVPLESLRQAQRTKEVFNVIIIVIAAISLIVGGIGIMNIMLASVTERTREIGIRRAVGASRTDIMRQFLCEALLISFSGGLLGLALGIGSGLLIEMVFSFHVAFVAWIMAVAAVTSMAIGIGFGIYPAYLAAEMNPVEALRTG
jgi:putative ABC transport system permease protein